MVWIFCDEEGDFTDVIVSPVKLCLCLGEEDGETLRACSDKTGYIGWVGGVDSVCSTSWHHLTFIGLSAPEPGSRPHPILILTVTYVIPS